MSDIVERLLMLEHGDICYPVPHPVCQSAADEIIFLRTELMRLSGALAHIYAWYPKSANRPHETIHDIQEYARAALKGAS